MFLAPINIIFQKVGTLDDHLVITPDEYDATLYHCEHKQHSLNTHAEFTLTTDTIREYLQLCFESIAEDDAKPDYVQFDIPTFPSICIHAEDTPYVLRTVLRQISFLQEQECWPLEARPCLGKPIKSGHTRA
jgi:hypothetical protein